MDRVAALDQTRKALLMRTSDWTAMYAGILLAIDTTTTAANEDASRADVWDVCTLDLREAAAYLAAEMGDIVALSPQLPPVDRGDTRLGAALKELLTVLAAEYRNIRPDLMRHDGVDVASLLDRAAMALP